MPKLRVHAFSISIDGYGAGPNQSADNPLGAGGEGLHEWVFETRFGRQMQGLEGGDEGLDNEFLTKGTAGIGATIMGRNMFSPSRGPWEDDTWKGWWGDEPPFHHPVFVLTHHPRATFEMKGGTTFNFVSDSIEAVLERAFEAANGLDVRLGGGVSTVQQYMRTGLVDEMHVAIAPVLLGSGERLFEHLDGGADSYECVELVSSPSVAHARFVRKLPG
jgi:dihydrofolate reductase